MDTLRRNFVAVCTSHFVTAVGMAAFLPFLPYYLADLGVGEPANQRLWAGVILGAAPLMAALCGPLWGALGDRVGRKIMVLRSLASILVFVGLMGFARTPTALLLLRLGQGVFSGFVAAGNTLVSVSAPPERQGRVLGLLQAALLLGFGLGPLLGGLLGDHLGHRPVFWITAGLAAGAFLVVLVLAREDPRRRRAAAGPLARDVRRTLLHALCRPVVPQLLLSLLLFRMGLTMMMPILPLYLLQLSPVGPAWQNTLASLLFAAVGLPTAVLAAWWGRRTDRVGPGRVFVLCALATALPFPFYALAPSAAALVALRFLQGLFVAGLLPAAYAATARLGRPADRGAAMGLTQAALQLAMAGGPVLGGGVAAWLGLRAVFYLAALLVLAAAWGAAAGWRGAVDAPGAGARGLRG